MNKTKNKLLILLVVLFVFIAVISNIQFVYAAINNWNSASLNQDAKSVWGERIAKLSNDLPETGMIGYISEQDIPDQAFDPIDTNEEYVLTQFYLLPRKVVQGTDFDYVIANLGGIENLDVDMVEQLTGLVVASEYGNGLYILERSN
jgi:hypothetical protein